MKAVLNLVQTTLDNLLDAAGVRVYWGRRAEITSDANQTEYVVYTLESDDAEVSADGDVLFRTTRVAVQYYSQLRSTRTYNGRQATLDRMDAIMEALRAAGFGTSAGWQEIGDVDDVGFSTFRSVYEIPRDALKVNDGETEDN